MNAAVRARRPRPVLPSGNQLAVCFRNATARAVFQDDSKEIGVGLHRDHAGKVASRPFNFPGLVIDCRLEELAALAGLQTDFQRHDSGEFAFDQPECFDDRPILGEGLERRMRIDLHAASQPTRAGDDGQRSQQRQPRMPCHGETGGRHRARGEAQPHLFEVFTTRGGRRT